MTIKRVIESGIKSIYTRAEKMDDEIERWKERELGNVAERLTGDASEQDGLEINIKRFQQSLNDGGAALITLIYDITSEESDGKDRSMI